MSQPRIAVVLEQGLSPRSQDDRHEYLITGLIMAFIGGILAFGFRSQARLARTTCRCSGRSRPIAKRFITTHGTIMVFWWRCRCCSRRRKPADPADGGADDLASRIQHDVV